MFRNNNGETLRALVHIRVEQADRPAYSQRLTMAVNHPSFLKLDSIPAFGVPDFFLSLSGDVFSAYIPGKNRFYTGIATKELLFSFFGIYISPDEIISMLTGKPAIARPYLNDGRFTALRNSRGDYRIEILSGSPERLIYLIRLNNQREITGMDVFGSDGRFRYGASFSDYGQTEGLSYPKRITLNIEEHIPTLVDIRLSDILVTMNDKPSFFDLPIPPGAEIIHMD
ncbi:MAG: DUF4292 domain-containing protein [Syntrophales bacterium]|nr:DUF4292 domain-containing protein [Syntrophales bacterium]